MSVRPVDEPDRSGGFRLLRRCAKLHLDRIRPAPSARAPISPQRRRGTTGDAARPVVVYFHGAGASAAAAMQDHALVDPILGRGYAFLAPVGLPRSDQDGEYWSLGTRPPQRDEPLFLQQILDDAGPRLHLDRSRVFVTGFSMGAALVWRLACDTPDAYAAYAPVEGGFWSAQANSCLGPVRLLLTQGWRDDAIPLEGRAQGPGRAGWHP